MIRRHLSVAAAAAAIAAFALASLASGQPFEFSQPDFRADILEATKRSDTDYTGFVFGFANATASDQTPNGMLQANQVNTNPFLSTLPGDGNGQTLITLGPCASNTPHTHPRGSEISTLLFGSIQFGMVEENAGENQLILRNLTQYQTIHIPTGILHFSINPTCKPAAFLANFATKDPGTQTIWNSLLQIPNNFLHAASGISSANWTTIKRSFPVPTAPGTGDENCLARCNLTFAGANKLTPVPRPAFSSA